MPVIYATTLGGREATAARDLCDCLYGQGDTSVECKPLTPGAFLAKFADSTALDRCLSMKYFKSLIKRVELYDYVIMGALPQGQYSKVKRIGEYIFIKI